MSCNVYIRTYIRIYIHIRITKYKLLILQIDHLAMYLDTCDCNTTLIGAVVGVICLVILIIVISNIMIRIYCFRKRHHTGTYVCL